MAKQNIFQGNSSIRNAIELILNGKVCDGTAEDFKNRSPIFTKKFFFQAYFYLTKRFGLPDPDSYDDYKEAAVWYVPYKSGKHEFEIGIAMNSGSVDFMIFGDKNPKWYIGNVTPFSVKRHRELLRGKEELLLPMDLEEGQLLTKLQAKNADKLFADFCKTEGIAPELSQEQFDKEYGRKWFDCVWRYNEDVIGVDSADYEKYGEYSNSYTRHAHKAMKRFLKSCLTETVRVRDVEFNIKGAV